ncbi:MAG: hypothetical protein IJH63_01500 [Methanobrevibacter sp.]|nr:hypothetical protein [Methanobrevibacter sp.]
MIILSKDYAWYRPYKYDKYIIKNIKFYDENGIVIEVGSGWLENNHKDLDYVKLNIDEIQLKRKEDFSIKGAFIISKGKDFSDELGADLYINIELVNLKFGGYKKEYDNIRKYYVGSDYDNQEFEVSSNVKWLKENWYKYQAIVQENAKKLENIYYDTTIDEVAECVKNIKKYADKMFKERQLIESYSIEDYLKEEGK